MSTQTIILLCAAAAALITYWFDRATRHFFRCFFFHACSGLVALTALWAAGHVIPVNLSVTPFSLAGSIVFGVPGILAMLLAFLV